MRLIVRLCFQQRTPAVCAPTKRGIQRGRQCMSYNDNKSSQTSRANVQWKSLTISEAPPYIFVRGCHKTEDQKMEKASLRQTFWIEGAL